MMENTVKIEKHGSNLGFYSVSIRRKWLIFSYWERLDEFLSFSGIWNPLLLKYSEARTFAMKAKDEVFVQEFKEQQKIKFIESRGVLMTRFLVQPEWYDEEDIWDRPFIYETNAKNAAERYVDMNFANLDYPQEVECVVLNCDTKERSIWTVYVESMPSFHAVKK